MSWERFLMKNGRVLIHTEKIYTVNKKSKMSELTSEYLEELFILRAELNEYDLLPELSEEDLERVVELELLIKNLKNGNV